MYINKEQIFKDMIDEDEWLPIRGMESTELIAIENEIQRDEEYD